MNRIQGATNKTKPSGLTTAHRKDMWLPSQRSDLKQTDNSSISARDCIVRKYIVKESKTWPEKLNWQLEEHKQEILKRTSITHWQAVCGFQSLAESLGFTISNTAWPTVCVISFIDLRLWWAHLKSSHSVHNVVDSIYLLFLYLTCSVLHFIHTFTLFNCVVPVLPIWYKFLFSGLKYYIFILCIWWLFTSKHVIFNHLKTCYNLLFFSCFVIYPFKLFICCIIFCVLY